jgi:hypothetical protein
MELELRVVQTHENRSNVEFSYIFYLQEITDNFSPTPTLKS